jgi:AcrR family transcriptional regulator
MTSQRPVHTLKHDDWIALGVDVLSRAGPGALTIDTLCARARRTKGSFYHHFKTIGDLRQAVARFWIEAEADALARIAAADGSPAERLEAASHPGGAGEAAMARGVRALAGEDPEIAAMVARADDRRELVLTTLVASAWPVSGAHAHNLARIFHALHIAALVRAPADPDAYARGPAATLGQLLEG